MGTKTIRCSCCGGCEIKPMEEKNLGVCSHCGATVLMPRGNEEIIGLLNTAYLQRESYDFDSAIKTYEYALSKDGNEKATLEGLLLAKFGIEYVKDPRSKKLVPTCHRTHFTSIFEDDTYLALLDFCDEEEKEVLNKKVQEIDKLQKAIAKQLEKEEDYDVFISYKATDENGEKTEDSVIARNIYDKLTKQNYKVFLAEKTLEDRLGSDYEPIIFKAIHTSKIFVLVGTKKEYVDSVWVKNEWTRFIDRIKTDKELSQQSFIPVFKDMSPYDMPKVNNKMVQGVDAGKLGYDITVADGIAKMLKPKEEKDVIKTFNSFENIVEFKKVQKQAKKEYNQKQYKELKENKKKLIPFLILQILCFAIPAVMIGLTFSIRFFTTRYAEFWAFIVLGVLWVIALIATILVRHKLLIGQSFLMNFMSSACVGVAIILTCLMFTGISYKVLYGINPTISGRNSYSNGCYYYYHSEKDAISSIAINGINSYIGKKFISPETLEDKNVAVTICEITRDCGVEDVELNVGSYLNIRQNGYNESGKHVKIKVMTVKSVEGLSSIWFYAVDIETLVLDIQDVDYLTIDVNHNEKIGTIIVNANIGNLRLNGVDATATISGSGKINEIIR